MARGLSVDLRKRVVGAYRRGEGSWERLAKRFGVSRSSVERWLKKEKETGSVEPLAHGGGKPALLDAVGHELLRAMLQEKPDRTIAELRVSRSCAQAIQRLSGDQPRLKPLSSP